MSIDLSEFSPDELQPLLDAAIEASDAVLVEVYARALEAAQRRWAPQPHQEVPDGPWAVWALLGGRGTGKSDAGSAAMDDHMLGPACDNRLPGGHRGRICGPTFTDTVASCVNGPAGLKAHNPEIKLVTTKEGTIVLWPNGAYARIFGAYTPEDPERFRAGGNSCFDWFEEMATWRQLDGVWDQAAFGLRLGRNPVTIITTTPKNRQKIRELVDAGKVYAATPPEERADLPRAQRVHISKGTTASNRFLEPDIRASLYAAYEGTRLGRQELYAEILDDLGTFFSRAWFGLRDDPTPWPRKVRSWDLAGTPPGPANEDPDWTVGALIACATRQAFTLPSGEIITASAFVIEDIIRLRDTPANVEETVKATALRDGPGVQVVIEREPGQSGKSQIAHFKQLLAGVALVAEFSPSGPKAVRAQLVSGAAEQGRVDVVRSTWNIAFFDEAEEFSGTKLDVHDDQIDAVSQGFAVLEGRGGPASIATPTARMPTREDVIGGARRMPGGGPLGGLPPRLGG